MKLFGIILLMIVFALVVGQGRRVSIAWRDQRARWGQLDFERVHSPIKFWNLFLGEVFLLGVASLYGFGIFYGLFIV